jgi:hypothetical protein
VPEPNLTADVALSIFRGLAGCKDYPFHLEGEKRRAGVLIEFCESVTHARQVIEEFDSAEDCPTVEAIRSAAKRLAEVCECGKAKWAHREGGACRRFAAAPGEDDDQWQKSPEGYSKFRQSVPMIPGVPWEVALQVQSLKIGIRPGDGDKFPEAVAAIYAGRPIDYKILESQMRALFPNMCSRHKLSPDVTTTERIAGIEKDYAVESISPES